MQPSVNDAVIYPQEAFDDFDWNHNGTISTSSLQYAMRRAGQNPTDVEVQDLINKATCLDIHEMRLSADKSVQWK